VEEDYDDLSREEGWMRGGVRNNGGTLKS
jgi:hypothetical protein